MTRIIRRLFAALLFTAVTAQAAPMSPDPTGYWYDPNESGWGVSIAQQGEVLFVTLLVYDEQRRAQWLVASDVTSAGNAVYSGPLYRTSGPWFGAAFDPGAVRSEAVGTLSLQNVVNFGGGQSLRITYTVNGVTVTKTVSRLTWKSNAPRLLGGYVGGMKVAAVSPLPGLCLTGPTEFPPGGEFDVLMLAPDTIAISHGEGTDLIHQIAGTYVQSGQLGSITGSRRGGSVGGIGGGAGDTAQVTNIVMTDDGFVGHVRIVDQGCVYEGPIGGIRRTHATPMPPDPTGFWYNAAESGWGVNIAQQGDVLFATLLVYDEQKRAQWLVASDVTPTQGSGFLSGTLYRTSGPPFAGAFDPSQVQAEAVGTLSLFYTAAQFPEQRSIQVSYTVNGVAVTKEVKRLTWQSNATRLPGAYYANIDLALAPLPQPAGCENVPVFPRGAPIRINMSAPDSIFMILAEGIDTVTVLGGQYVQSGQLGTITGGIFAGNVVNPLKMADAQATNLAVSDDGFAGHIRVAMNSCIYEGTIGGIRR